MKRLMLLFLLICGPSLAAEQALTAKTADTSPTSDDLIYTVDDPAGTPADRKVTLGNAAKGMTSTNLTDTANIVYEAEIDTSAEIAGKISDETGSGLAVFSIDPGLNIAGGTLLIPSSTSRPATCSTGQIYMDTDATSGQRLYACQSANTWVLQGDGSTATAGGAGEVLYSDGAGGFASEAAYGYEQSTNTLTVDNLVVNAAGSLIDFEGTTIDAYETTLTVVDPTADRTISLPNVSGTVVTTGDTGSVTSAIITNDSILEIDLKAVDAASDEECLTYETTTGDFEWQACGSGAGDITSVGDVTSGAAFDGTSGNTLIFEGSTADTNEVTVLAADPAADFTITVPAVTGTVVTTGDTGSVVAAVLASDAVTESKLKAVDAASDEECLTYETTTGDFEWQACGGGVSADSLDFIDLEDALDLDAALTVAQGTNTWSQTFTGTTGIGLTYTANSLTTGDAVNIFSSATGLTGDLTQIELTGANTGNTGNVVKIGFTGTTGTATAINVTNAGTGFTARFNDDGTYADTTSFVILSDGKVGIGNTAPAVLLDVRGSAYVGDGSGGYLTLAADAATSFIGGSDYRPVSVISNGDAYMVLDSDNNDSDTKKFQINKNNYNPASGVGVFTVLESGNVGIGNSAPAASLVIDEGTGVGQITLDGSTGGCLMFRDTDDAGWSECDLLDGVMTCSTDADGVCD